MLEIEQIDKDLQNILSPERYHHSKCTMDVCEELANIYGVDVETAKKVGLAHDIAKELTAEQALQYIDENNIQADEMEKRLTKLLHAKIGADITKKKYGFTPEMGQAISEHTTGKENMTLLSKILYIADCTGIDRDFPDVNEVREMARNNIDEAMIMAFNIVIKESLKRKREMHIDTILARNWLIKNNSEG